MADAAAKRHKFPTDMHRDAGIRKEVTTAVQCHLVDSWLHWCDLNRGLESDNFPFSDLQEKNCHNDFDDFTRDTQGQFVEDWSIDGHDEFDPFEHNHPGHQDRFYDDMDEWI